MKPSLVIPAKSKLLVLALLALAYVFAPRIARAQANYSCSANYAESDYSFSPDSYGETEVYAQVETDGSDADWYVEIGNYSEEMLEDIEYVSNYAGVAEGPDESNIDTLLDAASDYDEPMTAVVEVAGSIVRGDAYDFWGSFGACYLYDPTDYGDTDCQDEGIGSIDFITQANPPSISSISANSGAVGTSGSTVVNGQHLMDDFECSSATISGGVQTTIDWDTETTTQATVDFTIPTSGVTTGTQSLAMYNIWGEGSPVSFTIDDDTPIITSISPSTWQAGATTPVTFYGQHFGNNMPTLAFSDQSISYSVTAYSDTQITADGAVPGGDPGGQVTVSVTSTGYNGNGWNPAPGGGSAQSSPAQASVGRHLRRR
jgi:hypothetical protein